LVFKCQKIASDLDLTNVKAVLMEKVEEAAEFLAIFFQAHSGFLVSPVRSFEIPSRTVKLTIQIDAIASAVMITLFGSINIT
jgi:hypothetical protein